MSWRPLVSERVPVKNILLFLVAICLVGMALLGGGYFTYLVNLVGIFTLVSIGLNILTGLSGQISLGHAGFFAVGAYTTAILSQKLNTPFWLAIVIAGLFTTVIGALVALPALRLKNLYLAIATLSFGIVTQKMIFEWRTMTGGGAGFHLDRPALFGMPLGDSTLTWIIFFTATLGACSAVSLSNSRTGRALSLLRDSEVAASCLGIHIARYKVTAFAISAFYTGIAGGLYAYVVRYINPESFSVNMSIMFLAIIVIGGMGSVRGAVLGAAFYVLVPELVRGFKDAPGLIFGVSLMLVVILLPGGLTSLFKSRNKEQA